MIGIDPYIKIRANRKSKFCVEYSQQGSSKSRAFETEYEAQLFKQSLSLYDIFDISINRYLGTNKSFKHWTYLYHTGINFTESAVPFDPYIIGHWLGDGTSACASMTTEDFEILQYYIENFKNMVLKLNPTELLMVIVSREMVIIIGKQVRMKCSILYTIIT